MKRPEKGAQMEVLIVIIAIIVAVVNANNKKTQAQRKTQQHSFPVCWVKNWQQSGALCLIWQHNFRR